MFPKHRNIQTHSETQFVVHFFLFCKLERNVNLTAMRNYFTLSELCITADPLPTEVADKLLLHHILVMNPIRELLGAPITASQKSGYRPYAYELARGRNGKSQHTFGYGGPAPDPSCKGAIDWTTSNRSKLDKLQELLITHSPYTRIARYTSFIHCDYAAPKSGNRMLYQSNAQSNWVPVRSI